MAISFARLRVLDPSPLARRLLWHVLSIGSVSRDETEEHAAMDKAGLFLFRVRSGHGTLDTPGGRFSLKPGPEWWLLDLAHPRRYVPAAGERLETASVRFSGPGIDIWREEVLRGRAGLVFTDRAGVVRLRNAMAELMRLSRLTGGAAEWRVHEILTQILGVVLKAQDVLRQTRRDPDSPASRVVNAVQANPVRAWRAGELSAVAGISYSSLRKQFRAAQGRTLHAFLQQHRLEQARARLGNTTHSIKEIALHLNFSSEFYFSRWFHRETGMSPSRFRSILKG